MASKKFIYLFLIVFVANVESASLIDKSYEYMLNFGKSIAPNFMTLVDCFIGEDDFWNCAKEKAGKMLKEWDDDNDSQRRMWQEAADEEASSSGRAMEELPSHLGKEVEDSLNAVADLVQHGVARAFSRGHESPTVSISATTEKKKKKKKKKQPTIHLVQMEKEKKGSDRGFGGIQSWVVGRDNASDDEVVSSGKVSSGNVSSRGLFSDMWSMGEKAVDAAAEHAVESDMKEDGIEDKSSIEETRGKKKKKKKAILKLLILGAVLKAKIGTLLQILSFKLQVKFFLIALIGLGINLARFWLDVKKQHQPPQKVIYYEHAQHQHHYDHEEEQHGWGPWSRSMDQEESDTDDVPAQNLPYRAQIDRNAHLYNPYSRQIMSRA